ALIILSLSGMNYRASKRKKQAGNPFQARAKPRGRPRNQDRRRRSVQPIATAAWCINRSAGVPFQTLADRLPPGMIVARGIAFGSAKVARHMFFRKSSVRAQYI
ncbi:hypothetical protein NKJ50_28145, partial [Mesorhizobium sp. M0115]|uniref:hypothetical protein n=1 Tax=unclassified Mesorhizobium TaxID=325217 RepID=UPI003337D1E9